MSEETTIIEINGMKLQVDLRHAVRVDTLRIGDRVRVLKKGTDYSSAEVHSGIVIGFEPFESLPTIVVSYLKVDYNKVDIVFIHFNSGTKDFELIASIDDDAKHLDKAEMLGVFDRQITVKEGEAQELRERRDFFLGKFKRYWEPVATDPNEEETVN